MKWGWISGYFFLTVTHRSESLLQAADSLADPTEYENLFPGLKEAFAAEHYLRESCLGTTRPATDYPLVTVSFKLPNKVVEFCADNISILVSQAFLLYLNKFKLFSAQWRQEYSWGGPGIRAQRNLHSSCVQGSSAVSDMFCCTSFGIIVTWFYTNNLRNQCSVMIKMYFLQTQDSEESVAPTSVTAAAVTSATPEPAAPTAVDKEEEEEEEEEEPEISQKDKVGLVLYSLNIVFVLKMPGWLTSTTFFLIWF